MVSSLSYFGFYEWVFSIGLFSLVYLYLGIYEMVLLMPLVQFWATFTFGAMFGCWEFKGKKKGKTNRESKQVIATNLGFG